MKARGIALTVALVFLGACDTEVPTGPLELSDDIPVSFSFEAATPSNAAATAITPDAHTVILDHFDGATVGAAHGPLNFVASDIGLGQAGVFGLGNYVEYLLSGALLRNQGTFEMWIRPNTLAPPGRLYTGLLEFNWFHWETYASWGHMMYFDIYPNRDYKAAAWLFDHHQVERGASAVPVGTWTHLAVSWGPAGIKLYTNGIPMVGDLCLPDWWPYSMYAYLNYWGQDTPNHNADILAFNGLIDEFHFSKVQRTDAEILGHATLEPSVIELTIDIKPGSDDNPLNLRSKGKIPVAVLASVDFDAGSVDPATVTLGNDDGDDTPVAARSRGVPMASLEDVDGDGDLDLVLHFETQALVGNGDLSAGTTALCLNGNNRDGVAVHGCDGVRVVK